MTALSSAATLHASTYTVHSTWTAGANATSYQVRVTNTGGAVLDSGRVTTTAFDGHTTLGAGTQVNVTVTPYNQKRKGRSTSASLTLPDLTAPVGSYTVDQKTADGNVTLHQVSLGDDLSGPAAITQSVDWGDGTTSGPFAGTTTSFTHGYGSSQAVYHPLVTVTDVANNARSYELTTVVDDDIAPTGSVAVAPLRPWARWTKVTFTQVTLDDNLSATDDITRSIDWGDGSTTTVTGTSPATHVYTTAGVYTPEATAADEAGNTSTFAAAPVNVRADTAAPRIRLILPTHQQRDASKWAILKGRVRDGGTGAKRVQVKAIELRNGHWYAYRPVSKRWVVAGSKSAAWRKARTSAVTSTATHRWSSKLARLKVGVLVYRVRGIDNVANKSAWKFHRQVITRL